MMNDIHPSNCGESIKVGGTYVCKLSCVPCNFYDGYTCEKLKSRAFIDSFRKLFNEQPETIDKES